MALDVGGRFAEAERAYEWLRAHAARRRLVARVLRRRRGEGAHARHQRHLLRRERRVAPLPLHAATPASSKHLPGRRARDRLRARQPAPDRRDRVGRRSRRASTARARCSPDRRASTRRCAARSRPRNASVANVPTGSSRSARSPSRSRTGPSGSSTRTAGRWTGTTRSSSACCAATRPRRALASKWDTFVAPGRGVRCVSDQPWITAAETCELVMALDAIGLHERARDAVRLGAVPAPRRRLLLDRHELRRRPLRRDRASTSRAEQPTWNSAAVVLAANALGGIGPDRRACSAARACPAGSPRRSSSKRAPRSKPTAPRATVTDRLAASARAEYIANVPRPSYDPRAMRAWWRARSKPGTLGEGGVYATRRTLELAAPRARRRTARTAGASAEPPVGAACARPVVPAEPPGATAARRRRPQCRAGARPHPPSPRRRRADAPTPAGRATRDAGRVPAAPRSRDEHVRSRHRVHREPTGPSAALMVETLTQLGRVITEGAAAVVAAAPRRPRARRARGRRRAGGRIASDEPSVDAANESSAVRCRPGPSRSSTSSSGSGPTGPDRCEPPARAATRDRGRGARAVRRPLGRRLRDLRGHDDAGRPALPAPAPPRRCRASRAVRRHQHPPRRDVRAAQRRATRRGQSTRRSSTSSTDGSNGDRAVNGSAGYWSRS